MNVIGDFIMRYFSGMAEAEADRMVERYAMEMWHLDESQEISFSRERERKVAREECGIKGNFLFKMEEI